MKILHYSLGFPPFRTGGMTTYCMDLMNQQIEKGYDVSFIYPGVLRSKNKIIKIKSHGQVEGNSFKIKQCFEIINPLPIPLLDGIKDIRLFQIQKDMNVFNQFFNKNKYDIMHVHTFMGMPSEFLQSAKEAGVKLVYTSHDYFPLCPRGNLFYGGERCINDKGCADCILCNQNALSYTKMYLLQSNLYRVLKDKEFIRSLRKRHNSKLYTDKIEQNVIKSTGLDIDKSLKEDYQLMRKKNLDWLNKFDVVHFNSKNTLEVYKRYGKSIENSEVVSISNGAILDQRKYRKVKTKLRFGYLGAITTHKGYYLLKDSCNLLWSQGITNFELHIFASTDDDMPYLKKHLPYKYEELGNIMDCFDVLIVPSLCDETFGFTTLEALSFGLPVIITEHVGAKDLIINDKNGRIINGNINDLATVMKELITSSDKVDSYNQWIVEKGSIKTMSQHSDEIISLYKGNFKTES